MSALALILVLAASQPSDAASGESRPVHTLNLKRGTLGALDDEKCRVVGADGKVGDPVRLVSRLCEGTRWREQRGFLHRRTRRFVYLEREVSFGWSSARGCPERAERSLPDFPRTKKEAGCFMALINMLESKTDFSRWPFWLTRVRPVWRASKAIREQSAHWDFDVVRYRKDRKLAAVLAWPHGDFIPPRGYAQNSSILLEPDTLRTVTFDLNEHERYRLLIHDFKGDDVVARVQGWLIPCHAKTLAELSADSRGCFLRDGNLRNYRSTDLLISTSGDILAVGPSIFWDGHLTEVTGDPKDIACCKKAPCLLPPNWHPFRADARRCTAERRRYFAKWSN